MQRRAVATLTWVAGGFLGACWLGAIFWAAVQAGDPGDFSAFYGAARLWRDQGGTALYDFGAMDRVTRESFPGPYAVLPFIRPPFYALLLAPLAGLPARAALLTWLSLNAAALAGAVWVLARVTGRETSAVAWHAAIFFPAVAAFFNRQDVPLLLLAGAGAYLLLSRERRFSAGLLLSACMVKFHLLLLLPLVFIAQRNWRSLAGLLSGAGLAAALSLALVGPAGCAGYFRLLFDRGAPNFENYPDRQANVANLGRGAGLEVPLFLAAAVAAATVAAARRLAPVEALAAGWLGSLAVAPHVVISDYLLALPSLLLLAPLGPVCFVSSLVLLFPIVPALLVWNDRMVVAAPAAALVCLAGAVFHGRLAGKSHA